MIPVFPADKLVFYFINEEKKDKLHTPWATSSHFPSPQPLYTLNTYKFCQLYLNKVGEAKTWQQVDLCHISSIFFSRSIPKSTCFPGTWINYMVSVIGGQTVIPALWRDSLYWFLTQSPWWHSVLQSIKGGWGRSGERKERQREGGRVRGRVTFSWNFPKTREMRKLKPGSPVELTSWGGLCHLLARQQAECCHLPNPSGKPVICSFWHLQFCLLAFFKIKIPFFCITTNYYF